MKWLVKYDGEILGSVLTNRTMTEEEICDFAGVELAHTQEEYGGHRRMESIYWMI